MAFLRNSILQVTILNMIIMFGDLWCHHANAEEFLLSGKLMVEESDSGWESARVVRDTEHVKVVGDTEHIRAKRQTSTYISSIIDKSNSLRRLQGASNMFKMVWDPYLAKAAATYVGRCVYKHGYPADAYPYPDGLTSVGQNMYATTASTLDPADAVLAWYNEISDYNFNGPCEAGQVCGTCNPGKDCGHYTQVVWWNSYRVGCAHYRCNVLSGSKWTVPANFLMCYYAPPGNYIGQYPFVKGTACTKCGTDLNRYGCEDQLCVYKEANSTTTTAVQTTTTTSKPTTTSKSVTNSTTTTSRITTTSEKKITTTRGTASSTTKKIESTTARTTIPSTTTGGTTKSDRTTVTDGTTKSDRTTVTDRTTKSDRTTVTNGTTKSDRTTVTDSTTSATQTTNTNVQTTRSETTARPSEQNSTAASNTCGESTCPNGCTLTNQLCCSCTRYLYSRDCTCCPLGYICCPASPFFPRGAGCCPPGSRCRGDGSCMYDSPTNSVIFVGRSTTYATTQACPADPVLALTADDFISVLYLDGQTVPPSLLPNRFYPDVLDIIPLPRTVKVIAIMVTNIRKVGGILARSTDGRVSRMSSWRCMDYSLSSPPAKWMSPDFNDINWNYSAVFFRYGVVPRGYPYYALAPYDARIEWFWPNPNPGPRRYVYCRLTLTA